MKANSNKLIESYFDDAIEDLQTELRLLNMNVSHYEFSWSRGKKHIVVTSECGLGRTYVSVENTILEAALRIEEMLVPRCEHSRIVHFVERSIEELERSAGRRSVSASKRAKVIQRDGYICGICGGDVAEEDLEIDHIDPVSRGGDSHLNNLQVAHRQCNAMKGAKRDYFLYAERHSAAK